LVADLFQAALPAAAQTLSQPRLVAESLADYLQRHPDLDQVDPAPAHLFLTTGDPARATRSGRIFFGAPVDFELG
jgi:glutamate racemase